MAPAASDPASSTTFAEATAVKQLSSHTYSAYFPPDWVIGNGISLPLPQSITFPHIPDLHQCPLTPLVPHGGFVTSTFLRVASTHFRTTLRHLHQTDTTTLHLSFLRRTSVGPAVFTVRDAKLGRATSTVHITLRQHDEGAGEELVVGYFTHVKPSVPPGPGYKTSWTLSPPNVPFVLSTLTASALPSVKSPGQAILTSPNWAEHPSMPFSSFRRASERCRFLFPRAGQPHAGIIDQWISLRSGEQWDNESLGFVVDMFPQVVEALSVPGAYDLPSELALDNGGDGSSASQGGVKEKRETASHWYPTVLLNLDIKKPLPPSDGPQWLFVRAQAKQVKDGRYDLEVIVMDGEGELVALSHHVCLVLDAGRNLKRSTGQREKTKL